MAKQSFSDELAVANELAQASQFNNLNTDAQTEFERRSGVFADGVADAASHVLALDNVNKRVTIAAGIAIVDGNRYAGDTYVQFTVADSTGTYYIFIDDSAEGYAKSVAAVVAPDFLLGSAAWNQGTETLSALSQTGRVIGIGLSLTTPANVATAAAVGTELAGTHADHAHKGVYAVLGASYTGLQGTVTINPGDGILVSQAAQDITVKVATPLAVAYGGTGSAAGALDHGALAGLADDDHTQYRLESADHTHQTTGMQAGTLDHGLALTGLGDDDHTQYSLWTALPPLFTYQQAGDFLNKLTACKFMFGWLSPSDNGTEVDLSSLGHNANYVDASEWTASDQVRKALAWTLDFDGSYGGSGDYLSLGDHADFSFGDSSTDVSFTMGGWVETFAAGVGQSIISKYDNTTGSTKREYRFGMTVANTLTFIAYDESAGVAPSRTTDAAPSAGWHFVQVVYNSASGSGATFANGLTWYVDGVVVASTATNDASYVAMENLTVPCWIGAWTTTTGAATQFFKGDMGMMWMTKEALSAATIYQLYVSTRGYYGL